MTQTEHRPAHDDPELARRAADLHARAIVVDAVAPHMSDPARWDAWRDGGATAVAPSFGVRETSAQTIADLARWPRLLRSNADRFIQVRRVADIERAKAAGRIGVFFHLQDTTPFDAELAFVDLFYELGVRMAGLCYNFRNRVGDGCGERSDAGLSAFGRTVVREMNEVGMIVDCSHTGYRTSREAIELSTRPPVFSHSNPRALVDNGRNIPDELAVAVAEKEGLVGLGGVPYFVSAESAPTIDDWLDQLEHWIQLVGPDHVGLGLDFFHGAEMDDSHYRELLDGFYWFAPDYPTLPQYHPHGLEDASRLPAVTLGLLRRGYGEEDVLKVLGGNWMRVFAAAWRDE